MGHIITVAHVGHCQAFGAAELLEQSKIVGQTLTRVILVAQRVNDRHVGSFRKSNQCLVREYTSNNGIGPARKVSGYVNGILASGQLV